MPWYTPTRYSLSREVRLQATSNWTASPPKHTAKSSAPNPYTALDHVVLQVVQNAMKGARKWRAGTTHHFTDITIIGVVMVVISAIGSCIFGEHHAVLRRPTIVDWKPRRMEVQEAPHLVAKGRALRVAIPEVRYSLCKHISRTP